MKKQGRKYHNKFLFEQECLEYDVKLVKKNYKWLWLLLLLLLLLLFIPLKKTMHVHVIDEAYNPIEKADVQFQYNAKYLLKNGKFFKTVGYNAHQTTDTVGMTTFKDINYTVFSCVFQLFSHADITVTAKGYNAEEVSPFFHFRKNHSVIEVIMHKEEFCTLNFRTLDGEDHSLLPDVNLEIKVNGQPYDSITNSGNGEFSMIVNAMHLVSIKADKQFYFTNTQITNRRVKELAIANQIERDIIMERNHERTLNFRTLDSITKALLGDVELRVTINGKAVRVPDNSGNGEFTITAMDYDTISIHAEKKGYLPNDKIHNRRVGDLFDAEQSERDILMKRIPERELKFRTLDGYDMQLLPNARLTITVNGIPYTQVTNSGNGEFTLILKYDAVVSIHAEKQGYLPNDQIYNRLVEDLYDAPQRERDIIMELPPCQAAGDDNTHSSGGSVIEYDMKKDFGTFVFAYYTDSAADHIIVYDCRKNERNPSKIIFDENIATDNSTLTRVLTFTSRVITVEVIGNTRWNYTVNCPD